jgi:hypothetical protein
MDITTGDAIVAQKAIEDVAATKMPAKLAYRLGRINDKLIPIKTRYEKTRNDLVLTKYGVAAEDKPDNFSVPPENLQAFLAEITTVLSTVESIDTFSLSIEDFGDLEFSPAFFESIKPFMVD